MRNIINIKGNNQIFPYLIEYSKGRSKNDSEDITWSVSNDTIHLLQEQIKCYRVKNNWVSVDSLTTHNTYIPNLVNTSSIKIYLPSHSAATYINAIKYSVTATTYINGMKVDLGTFVFKPNDAIAISSGTIKKGNNEYQKSEKGKKKKTKKLEDKTETDEKLPNGPSILSFNAAQFLLAPLL